MVLLDNLTHNLVSFNGEACFVRISLACQLISLFHLSVLQFAHNKQLHQSLHVLPQTFTSPTKVN